MRTQHVLESSISKYYYVFIIYGMMPMHLVWVSSSHMPWYGQKPLGAMVDTKHVKYFIRKRVFQTWYECT